MAKTRKTGVYLKREVKLLLDMINSIPDDNYYHPKYAIQAEREVLETLLADEKFPIDSNKWNKCEKPDFFTKEYISKWTGSLQDILRCNIALEYKDSITVLNTVIAWRYKLGR